MSLARRAAFLSSALAITCGMALMNSGFEWSSRKKKQPKEECTSSQEDPSPEVDLHSNHGSRKGLYASLQNSNAFKAGVKSRYTNIALKNIVPVKTTEDDPLWLIEVCNFVNIPPVGGEYNTDSNVAEMQLTDESWKCNGNSKPVPSNERECNETPGDSTNSLNRTSVSPNWTAALIAQENDCRLPKEDPPPSVERHEVPGSWQDVHKSKGQEGPKNRPQECPPSIPPMEKRPEGEKDPHDSVPDHRENDLEVCERTTVKDDNELEADTSSKSPSDIIEVRQRRRRPRAKNGKEKGIRAYFKRQERRTRREHTQTAATSELHGNSC